MTPSDPYRDDRATLAAENERLRHENARLRGMRRRAGGRVALVAVLVGFDVLAFELLRAMINAPSDGRALGGMMLAAVLFALHILLVVRLTRRSR